MRYLTAILGVALVVFATTFAIAETTPKTKKNMDGKDKVVTTPSGLKYVDVVAGTGATPKSGQTVVMNYTGTFEDGKKFDSNVDPAFHHVEPFTFPLGQGRVIKGWDEGISTMKVGGKRKLIIPPELAYGSTARGPIPANSTLLFDVELVSIK